MKLGNMVKFAIGAIVTGSDAVKDMNITDVVASAAKSTVKAVKSIDIKAAKASVGSYLEDSKAHYENTVSSTKAKIERNNEEMLKNSAEIEKREREVEVMKGKSKAELLHEAEVAELTAKKNELQAVYDAQLKHIAELDAKIAEAEKNTD